MQNTQIEGLYIYPVKSLAGIALQSAKAGVSGLEGDRQWIICDDKGRMITQRQDPHLALIQPRITDRGLALHAPGMDEIEIPSPDEDSEVSQLKVWKDHCPGQACSPEAGQWLQEFLKSTKGFTLYKVAAQGSRQYMKPERFGIQGHYFSDSAPYLVANIASLEQLNQNLQKENIPPVDIRHFRANIIISGPEAFSEHSYQKLADAGDSYHFRLVDHCRRCAVITVDPDKGEYRAKATPIQNLSQLNAMPDNPKAPAFGVNATLSSENSVTLTVGQQLAIS